MTLEELRLEDLARWAERQHRRRIRAQKKGK